MKTGLFLAGQTISLFGSSLVQYAILWHLTLEMRSGMVMTAYILAGFIPSLFLSPFAGVWADRYDRKKLIVLADGFIALVSLVATLFLARGFESLALYLTVAAFRSFGSAVHQPAVGAFLPGIVPPESLMRVNGINGSLQSALMLVSPMAAGALLVLLDIHLIFLVDVLTALVAIAILVFFVRHTQERAGANAGGTDAAESGGEALAPAGYLKDIRDGIRYIREHRYLISFFAYMGAIFFLVSPAAFLTTVQTARTFGGEVWRLTAIEIVFSVGMLAGGALIASWGGFTNRIKTIVLGNAGMAVCTVGLALSPFLAGSLNFAVYLAFMGIFGIALPLLNTPSTVLLQEQVDSAYLGRTFGVFSMISSSLMPVAMLVFGPLADVVAIEWILLVCGILMLVLAVSVRTNRRLIEAGRRVSAG